MISVFNKSNKDIFATLLLVLLTIPVVFPYFHKGYFPTHDGEWAVVRLSDMYREVKDLQIPARYSGNLNYGYGYPLFNFAYPFPYYAGLAFHFIGFGFVDSIKLLFTASVILSAVFMYFASGRLWGSKLAGVISGILYIYLPYRMVDLYVRGSIGESLSFIIFPFILLCFTTIYRKKNNSIFIPLLSVSVAVLITTHNIMSVLFAPVIFAFFIPFILSRDKKALLSLMLSIILGVMLSAFFWLPALTEKKNILLSIIPIANRDLYYVSFFQLFENKLGYGTPTDVNSFSYQIGLPHVVAYFFVLLLGIYFHIKKKDKSGRLAVALVFFTFILSLLLFRFSSIFWENAPLFKEINYPWTLLAIIGFLITLTAGYLGRGKKRGIVGMFITFIAIIFYLPYARPQYYVDRSDGFYFTNDATTTSSDELMPLWVKEKPSKRAANKVEVLSPMGKISNLTYNSRIVKFNVNLPVDSRIRVNTIYYPGWKAFIDGNKTQVSFNNKSGVMDLFVPKFSRKVELIYTETPLRLFANNVSLIAFIITLILILFKFRILLKHSAKK